MGDFMECFNHVDIRKCSVEYRRRQTNSAVGSLKRGNLADQATSGRRNNASSHVNAARYSTCPLGALIDRKHVIWVVMVRRVQVSTLWMEKVCPLKVGNNWSVSTVGRVVHGSEESA